MACKYGLTENASFNMRMKSIRSVHSCFARLYCILYILFCGLFSQLYPSFEALEFLFQFCHCHWYYNAAIKTQNVIFCSMTIHILFYFLVSKIQKYVWLLLYNIMGWNGNFVLNIFPYKLKFLYCATYLLTFMCEVLNFIKEFCLLSTPIDLIRLVGKRNAQKVRKPTPHTHIIPREMSK